jgi:hypothetical protein
MAKILLIHLLLPPLSLSPVASPPSHETRPATALPSIHRRQAFSTSVSMSPPSVDPGGHERVKPPEDACRRELVGEVIAGSRGATIVHHCT